MVCDDPPQPADLPEVCRDIVIDYSKQVMTLGFTLFELLSEALGTRSFGCKCWRSSAAYLERQVQKRESRGASETSRA
ncbi:hypothetical protein V6N11_065700 [Hibiscus sabdariffa]|uniref:Uncharacterized protein n=1 Tax=Hibiscus sabdariffa TaxID=183260 RepID=A0ABR2PI42_9ROSI